MQIIVRSLGKNFGAQKVFKNLNFELSDGQSLAITGPNGSGKTTLVRVYSYIGLVGPYLELYEELTALENLRFFARMRGIKDAFNRSMNLLQRLGLDGRGDDPVKNYSSGMRQRLKYVFALLHEPHVLILDEPTSNLDVQGVNTVYGIMTEQKKDKILILATNDQADVKYGDQQIAVGP